MSNKFTIVLDAGHGGAEKIGGSSPNNATGANGLLEKNLTLDIARRTAAVLKDAANVVLTRDADVNLSLAERADIARRNNASLFLSIHFNGWRDAGVDGAETFVAPQANPRSEKFAQDVLQNLVRATGISNRGIKFADLGVLLPNRHAAQTAACLAEIAFLTNPPQAGNLENAAYRQRIAHALGDAILKNLPMTRVPQSFSFDDEDDLNATHFQPLDAVALGGDPVFDIKKPVGAGGKNEEADVDAVKQRLIELGFDWLTSDKKIDSKTIGAIKLFQTIIGDKNSISGDGKIDVGKNTYGWLQAVNAPRWQTMPAGSQVEGFFNYELSDTKDTHDHGTDWMAETIKSAAAHYRDNYLKTHTSAALLTVNDVSLPHGGNTPDHAGHEAGLACDLQLPRTDGKAGGIDISIAAQRKIYDQNAARAVLKALRAQTLISNIYFNDADLIKEGLCAYAGGHDHHIHFEIKPPARGGVERKDIKHYRSGGKLYQGSYQDDIDYQTHALDAACSNTVGIMRDEKYLEFGAMARESDRPNNKENVFLRWCDIPKGQCEVDIVVHFHGWNVTNETKFFEYAVKNSGLDLLKPDGTLTRQRPTLAILPFGRGRQMPAPDTRINYNFPFFTDNDNGLRRLIDFSLKYLADRYKTSLVPGRLILTAHSGGGAAVSAVLGFNKYEAGKIQIKYDVSEVHLFDSTYGNQQNVINWAKYKIVEDSKLSAVELPKKRGALRVLYTPFLMDDKGGCVNHGTAVGSKQIDAGIKETLAKYSLFEARYRIQPTRIEHNSVPKTFGFQLLADASSKLDDTFATAAIHACYRKSPAKYGVKEPFTQQSLEYEEPDYFAAREASFMNY